MRSPVTQVYKRAVKADLTPCFVNWGCTVTVSESDKTYTFVNQSSSVVDTDDFLLETVVQ